MKITALTSVPETGASYRYRIDPPISYMAGKGHEIVSDGADVVLIGKPVADSKALGIRLKEIKCPIIWDVCDNHFIERSPLHDSYRVLADNADTIVASTLGMARLIKDQTGRDAHVIPDPYLMPQQEARLVNDVPTLLWYGSPSSLPELRREAESLRPFKLICVGSGERSHYPDFAEVIEWSPHNLRKTAERADIVVIPTNRNVDRAPAKSANRAIEGLRLGKFVVAQPLESYIPLLPYIHISNSLVDGIKWGIAHKNEAYWRTVGGQRYILEAFSLDKIGRMWESVFHMTVEGI